MFGQGHSFSGSMGGSAWQKENGSDMLRDMLRGRGATGGGQSHDTGKREYMFPSFLHSTHLPPPLQLLLQASWHRSMVLRLEHSMTSVKSRRRRERSTDMLTLPPLGEVA
jgi:hypothetical protein